MIAPICVYTLDKEIAFIYLLNNFFHIEIKALSKNFLQWWICDFFHLL